ncbi:MAG: DMT family transporter, partial [Alicyclobacillus sp.]|nr:DMT family transporter [Alicyclobacillus sp.]
MRRAIQNTGLRKTGLHRTSLYALLVLLAGSSYGVVSVLVKEAVDHGCDVTAVTVGQYVVATGLLWLCVGLAAGFRRLRWRPGKASRGVTAKPKRARLQLGLLAAIGLSSMATSYAYYKALSVLPASLAIVLLFQFSWLVLLLDIGVTRRWPGVEKWAGAGLIVAGTVLAVGVSSLSLRGVAWHALALGLLSALTYGLSLYLSGYVHTDTPPLLRSAVTVSMAAIAIVCWMPAQALFSAAAWPRVWFWSLAIAVFGQALPQEHQPVLVAGEGKGNAAGGVPQDPDPHRLLDCRRRRRPNDAPPASLRNSRRRPRARRRGRPHLVRRTAMDRPLPPGVTACRQARVSRQHHR